MSGHAARRSSVKARTSSQQARRRYVRRDASSSSRTPRPRAVEKAHWPICADTKTPTLRETLVASSRPLRASPLPVPRRSPPHVASLPPHPDPSATTRARPRLQARRDLTNHARSLALGTSSSDEPGGGHPPTPPALASGPEVAFRPPRDLELEELGPAALETGPDPAEHPEARRSSVDGASASAAGDAGRRASGWTYASGANPQRPRRAVRTTVAPRGRGPFAATTSSPRARSTVAPAPRPASGRRPPPRRPLRGRSRRAFAFAFDAARRASGDAERASRSRDSGPSRPSPRSSRAPSG